MMRDCGRGIVSRVECELRRVGKLGLVAIFTPFSVSTKYEYAAVLAR